MNCEEAIEEHDPLRYDTALVSTAVSCFYLPRYPNSKFISFTGSSLQEQALSGAAEEEAWKRGQFDHLAGCR